MRGWVRFVCRLSPQATLPHKIYEGRSATTMTGAETWTIWIVGTILLNASLSVASRAKNSASLGFNFTSSWLSGVLYIGSLIGVGRSVLDAHSIPVAALAIGFYATASAVGSTAGQWAVLKLPFLRRLEHPNDFKQVCSDSIGTKAPKAASTASEHGEVICQ